MTKQESQMWDDLKRYLDDHMGAERWEETIEDYTQLYEKWRGHPMIRILGPAATEYLEKRWDHMSGRC